MSRLGSREQLRDARFRRLAQSIDVLAEKDESFLRHAREIAALRRSAATGLHAICSGFVGSVNRLLSSSVITCIPATTGEAGKLNKLLYSSVKFSLIFFPPTRSLSPRLSPGTIPRLISCLAIA